MLWSLDNLMARNGSSPNRWVTPAHHHAFRALSHVTRSHLPHCSRRPLLPLDLRLSFRLVMFPTCAFAFGLALPAYFRQLAGRENPYCLLASLTTHPANTRLDTTNAKLPHWKECQKPLIRTESVHSFLFWLLRYTEYTLCLIAMSWTSSALSYAPLLTLYPSCHRS